MSNAKDVQHVTANQWLFFPTPPESILDSSAVAEGPAQPPPESILDGFAVAEGSAQPALLFVFMMLSEALSLQMS